MRRRFILGAFSATRSAAWVPFVAIALCLVAEAACAEGVSAVLESARRFEPLEAPGSVSANRERAIALYREVLRRRPDSPDNIEIDYRLGNLLERWQGPPEKVAPPLREALEIYSDIIVTYPAEHPLTAKAAVRAGRLRTVLDAIEGRPEFDPDGPAGGGGGSTRPPFELMPSPVTGSRVE